MAREDGHYAKQEVRKRTKEKFGGTSFQHFLSFGD